MKKLKVDRKNFYNLLENLFNQIYGKDYVKQKEIVKEDNSSEKNTIYVENIKYLETQDKKELVKTTQVSKIITNKGVKGKESHIYLNDTQLTENQLKAALQKDALEYNFLAKLPIILKSINIKENQEGKVLTLPKTLNKIIVEELVDYEKKDMQNQEELEINLYEKTKNKTRVKTENKIQKLMN